MRLLDRAAIFLVLLVISAGCGDDGSSLPPPADSGTGADSGGLDAAPDADTGPLPDTGSTDTDPPLDTGSADTGPVSMPCTAIGPCDPFDEASCPAGQGCQPGIGMTECVDLDPLAGAIGETCARPDACGPGLLCLDFGDGLSCRQMCPDGSIGFCGDGQACVGAIGGDMCIRICRPISEPCNIYLQDCVDPMDACTLARHPETGVPYTGCRPEGPGGVGNPCGGDDGFCMRGLICIREMGIATCRQVCGPDGDPPTCAAGTCDGFATTWMVPYCR